MRGPNPLKKISLFSGLTRIELALLDARATRTRFPENTLVIREGEVSDSMFVILSGKVKVFRTDDQGKEVPIDFMGKGGYFGEYAMLDGSKRSASVVTTEPSDFMVISKDTMLDLFAESPDMAFSLIRDLVTRIRELNYALERLESK
jgi:CRP/FNR family cyclic AMP-dependent transcriptional regulator